MIFQGTFSHSVSEIELVSKLEAKVAFIITLFEQMSSVCWGYERFEPVVFFMSSLRWEKQRVGFRAKERKSRSRKAERKSRSRSQLCVSLCSPQEMIFSSGQLLWWGPLFIFLFVLRVVWSSAFFNTLKALSNSISYLILTTTPRDK